MFTGEVLGQRPMSQHRKALKMIDRETGLEGKLLRPLSGRAHVPPHRGRADGLGRSGEIVGHSGRGRKPQIESAEEDSGLRNIHVQLEVAS